MLIPASEIQLNKGIGYVADTGAVNAYVATIVPAIFSLTTGIEVTVRISVTNTSTTPTLNVNGLGVKTIIRNDTGGVLNVGDLQTGVPHKFVYDGTNWRLINPYSTITASSWPSFSVHRNGVSQSLTANVVAKIQWTTEEFDTNSNFDVTTNYRFTPTVAGKYLLCACWLLDSNIALARGAFVYIYKNGAAYKESALVLQSSNGHTSLEISVVVDANGTTDYFEVYAKSEQADTIGGAALSTWFTGCRIG